MNGQSSMSGLLKTFNNQQAMFTMQLKLKIDY